MKNLITYLKTLWSRVADSQSTDVSYDCRLTVGSPSGLDAKWKQNPFMRFAVVLTLIFTIGSGNAWAETVTFSPTGNQTSEGDCSQTSSDITISWHGKDDNYIKVYKGQTLSITTSHTITALSFTFSNGSNNGGWNGSTASYSESNLSTSSWSKTTTGGKSGKQARITELIVTYTPAGGGCSAPAAPTISGTAAYTAGETIELTAACASGADASTTYTWYKGDTWDAASATTPVQAASTSGATLEIDDCVVGDAGTYWCEASNGSGCEAHNTTGKAITVSAGGGGGGTTYVLTDLEDIESDAVVVIVGNNGDPYAMSNNNGTTNPPSAVGAITISGTTLTTNETNIQWNITQSNGAISAIYPNGSTTTWLYCTNTNNGVRVGTNANKAFTIDGGYLKHTGTSRYVGIYNSQDWRCYTGRGGNIENQTFSFYVLQDDCDDPATALSVSASPASIETGANTTLTASGGNGGTISWEIISANASTGSLTGSGATTRTFSATAVGTYTIKVSQAKNGDVCPQSATVNVTVVAATVNVTGVTVDPTTKAIVVGETFNITPTVTPANATDKTVSWTSANASIASVSSGTVTGVAAGSATITCTTTDGGYTATCAVTVRSVTLQAKDEDGNPIASGGPGAPTRSGTTITAAANAGNYVFKQWSITNATAASTTTSPTTLSNPTGAVTVTAVYYKPINVTWKVGDDNASGGTTQVAYNTKITTLPTKPDGSPCDKTFVGWTNTTSYTHGTSLLFTDAAGSPAITANTNFYAVFATESSGVSSVFSENFNTCAGTGGNDGEWSGSIASSDVPDGINSTWTLTNAKAASECLKLGTGSAGGSAVTPSIDCGSVTTATLTFKAGAWDKTGEGTTLNVSATNCTLDKSFVTLVKGSFTSYSVAISSITSSITITFSTDGANKRFFLDDVVVSASTTTYTGHTITCADCGTSVTPTFTAAPAGGTVAVTKSASPVTSGSTVKTCTAVDLTVTLTPATHYDLTGFTATGLTTGTATITPAVGSTLPVSVAQTFTVTVSAGATGTLTLAPTFTAQTPLSITLETHSKGTFTPIGDIYSGETFTFPDVTPSDPTCATFVGWIAGTSFSGDGSTHDAPVTIAAGSTSDAQNANATYTAVFYETETTETDAYVKVTETPASWANDHYLIVYEGDATHAAVAFDGKRDNGDNGNIDAVSNGVEVTITNDAIAKTARLAAAEWRIAAVTGGHSIQSASGFYIGQTTDANGLQTNSSTAYVNTLAYSSGFSVTGSGNAVLRYNYASDQLRFRYYKSSSYSSQQVIQLYKLGTAEVQTRTYTTNPSCTPKYRVTVASVTGGSPNADPRYNPESTEVSLTANPSAGYSFTGWTITKTTGGDNVTTTLLPGTKATTANTTFSMPAYDVTVTASFAKKVVSELKVMDGSTVVANTTGSVSGTVNVSTGANKTLDVVITPADAFDHSWTASVTAGGTYASITNVTDDGFRVNGLAQGDATITVNAPNDGSAKSVTLTVHVTDILPEEIILKRDGSNTPIETLIMYYDASESKGQYVKVNVGYSPSNPTNKAFTFSSAATGKVGSHSHAPASGYEVLVANGVTTDPVNCTFTSSADGSVTKVLAVTVLPILTDRFVDYVHGNATQTVSARLSADRYTMITDINTPSLSDASDANPTSEDCETAHYHLIGWLPQTTAEALMAAGTPITEATEGLVRAGVQVEATGQTWCAIWAEEAE